MIALSNGTIKIGAYNMKPSRKKPCLCVEVGNELTKYASFNNDESAELFMKILTDFVGAKENKSK